MIATFPNKLAVSFKKEIAIVLGVLVVVLSLPVFVLFSMTSLSAVSEQGSSLYTGKDPNENLYDYGYCTWWASKRRSEVGLPIPQHMGDAHYWDDAAFMAGYKIDHTPTPFAIMQTDAGKLGHVAFVEEVSGDGSWVVSEMNVKGWDVLSSRTFSADQAKDYNFIH